MMRLTDGTVGKLTLPDGKSDHLEFDQDLPGFGIRLRAGGSKTWLVQYKLGPKQRRVKLGRFPTLRAEEARKEARKVLAKAGLGQDHQADRQAERAKSALTFKALAERWLDLLDNRPKTAEERQRHLLRDWKGLHGRAVHRIERGAIAARLLDLASEHGPIAANRSRSTLLAFFAWAVAQGFLDANPVIGTEPPGKEVRRDRVLSDAEIREVWQACGADDYGRIVRLLLMTGQRREEVGALRWSELDLHRAQWTLPAERTKNHLAHDLPLSSRALSLIAVCPRRAGRDLLFGRGEASFCGWSQAKRRLDERILKARRTREPSASPMRPWTIHDIRRSVVTGMNELGIQPHIVEAVVNHVSGMARAGVAGVYNRAAYAKEKRVALQAWADHLDAVLGLAPAKVVPLRA